MKITPPPLNTILLIAVAVLLTLQIQSWFGRGSRPNDYYKEKIADKDSIISERQKLIDQKEEELLRRDERISQLEQRDSVLISNYLKNQTVYKKIDAQLKDIPNRISRIAGNDDSIRAAFSN